MERRELFKILGATAVAAELGLAQHLHETIPAETYTARAFRPVVQLRLPRLEWGGLPSKLMPSGIDCAAADDRRDSKASS